MNNLFDVIRHLIDRVPQTWRTEAEKLAAQDIVTAFQDKHYPPQQETTEQETGSGTPAAPGPEANPFTSPKGA